ncbi:hypothetical protein [Salinactinospora qingdaonensis]|uniref:Uncharacterized protein n=1 Tax=Salinactinospora qingdaonensis TaxID=702744 RepID=A0ABP7EXK8_9ACTN
MTHYPQPSEPEPEYPQQPPTPDPFSHPGYPSGGHPAGGMVPYNPTAQTGGWQAPPGYQTPPPSGGQTLAVLGDITVTEHEINTPSGRFPLRGSVWSINDMSYIEQRMATWGLVLGLILMPMTCALSLLFLLAKETTVSGSIQVSVRSGERFHTTHIPVRSQGTIHQVHQQFNHVRSLASMA